MSRTDKDAPWWTIAEWWEPMHYRCTNARSGWGAYYRDRECDLPSVPRIKRPPKPNWKKCHWQPVWPDLRNYMSSPPHWFIDHVWNEPSRRRVRDDCRRAIQEYRATGEVDVMPPIDQHRQCAGWLYW